VLLLLPLDPGEEGAAGPGRVVLPLSLLPWPVVPGPLGLAAGLVAPVVAVGCSG
jgi:hypothetical protein